MIELNQYLIPALVGLAIGIWLVLLIVKAVLGGAMMNPGMMNGAMMNGGHYPPHYYGGGGAIAALFGFVFVLLIIVGTVYLSDQVQKGEGPLSGQDKQRERTWVDKLQADDVRAPQSQALTPDWEEGLQSASTENNPNNYPQRPQDQPVQQAGMIPVNFGAPTSRTQPTVQETPAAQEPNNENYYVEESFYIQTGAGSNKTAAYEAVRKLQHRLPGHTWLGVKEYDTDYFKFLVGPFSDRQSAKEANRRWGLNGYVRDAKQEGIEVFSVN